MFARPPASPRRCAKSAPFPAAARSAYECWLDPQGLDTLAARVAAVFDPAEDSFLLLLVARDAELRTLGVGVLPADPAFTYLG